MRDDDSNKKEKQDERSGVSRRDFLKISSISVAVPLVAGPKAVLAAGEQVPVHGPGAGAMQFTINGKKYKANLEPRVTLLDALRDEFDITGAKRVCDRAECGACTVLINNKPVYACSVLAIEAQGKQVTTVESLMQRTEDILARNGVKYEIKWEYAAKPFLTERGALVEAISGAIKDVTGIEPELSTTGGTSDGRFIADICPQLVEFGPTNATIHKINECIALDELERLPKIYRGILERLLS